MSRRSEVFSVTAMLFALSALFVALSDGLRADPVAPSTSTDRASSLDSVDALNADIPSSFSYQGVLRNPDGSLVTGDRNLTIRIYGDPTGGTALHTESFNATPVRDGMFNVVLGDATAMPASLFTDHPNLFVGVTVGTDSELIPRQRLHAQPWAMRATAADSASTAGTLVDGATVNGLNLGGTTTFGGNLSMGGTWPIIVKRWLQLPSFGYAQHDTKVSLTTHVCTIGGHGWWFDIDEGHRGGRYQLWTDQNNENDTGTWWVYYWRPMQNANINDANVAIDVICFDRRMADFQVIDAGFVTPTELEAPASEAESR